MTLKRALLEQVSREVAMDFMGRYEHLGDVGLGVWHYGLKLDGELISVVSFGTTCFSMRRGWLPEVARQTDCKIVQLCRGGSIPYAPTGTASRAVCLALHEIYKSKGSHIIVAYADPLVGEVGTIYQACNAVYTGMTSPKGQANYIIHGRKVSGWNVRKLYGTRSTQRLKEIDHALTVIPLHKKHRYILLACSRKTKSVLNGLLSPYNLPYPHRTTSSANRLKFFSRECMGSSFFEGEKIRVGMTSE